MIYKEERLEEKNLEIYLTYPNSEGQPTKRHPKCQRRANRRAGRTLPTLGGSPPKDEAARTRSLWVVV